MAEAIRMPLLSDTMKEGVIAEWHKKVGDEIKSDDVIADVETDKATMEVMPYVEGTLLYIGVEKGQAAKVNDIIAIIGKEGEDYQSLLEHKSDQPTENNTAKKDNGDEKPEADSNKEKDTAEKTDTNEKEASGNVAPSPDDATVIRMPLLSDTMKEGKIIAWHKKVGDEIKSDDILADVETDKATMEVMPYVDGTLLYIGVEEGQAAKVNDIIAIVGKAGTDVTPFLKEDTQESDPKKSEEKPKQQKQESTEKEQENIESTDGDRVKASPLAKKIAAEKGIDINDIQGSGDGGRVIKRDIDNYKPSQKTAAKAATTATESVSGTLPVGEEGYEDYPLSQMRKVIAERLSESKFTAPHFYLKMTVAMDKAMEARKAVNDVAPVKVSFNDFVIKAVAMALRKHPEVNSSWTGEAIRRYHHIHIGSAVAIDDGLIVPVIKFADQKSLSQIADESKKLADRARTKKLQPQEFTGNTFTISNLGMMDIDEFTAIINPPDSCILAIGKITATPVIEEDEMVVRNLMKLTLSCDHRVVDGAVGARFLQTLKAYIENPVMMLV